MIRPASEPDREEVWQLLQPVIRGARTYALPPELPRAAALEYWWAQDAQVWVATAEERVVGSYYLRPAQRGGGSHVANCGFIVDSRRESRGIGRALLEHAIATARELAFLAMQFNFVISTNVRAVALWRRAGFETVGVLPLAFRLPDGGLTDVFVMHRLLDLPRATTAVPSAPAATYGVEG